MERLVPRPHPYLAWVAILWLGLLTSAVAYLLVIDRASVLTHPPVQVFSTELDHAEGDDVWIAFEAQRNRNCDLSVFSQWRGDDGVVHVALNSNKAVGVPGERNRYVLKLDLPPRAPGGIREVRSVGEYRCPDGGFFVVGTDWVEVKK